LDQWVTTAFWVQVNHYHRMSRKDLDDVYS
jgi:hypothetical protein